MSLPLPTPHPPKKLLYPVFFFGGRGILTQEGSENEIDLNTLTGGIVYCVFFNSESNYKNPQIDLRKSYDKFHDHKVECMRTKCVFRATTDCHTRKIGRTSLFY